jgi:hypothetical protein
MAAFSADSSLVAFSCFSGAVTLFEVETGKLVDVIYPKAGRVLPLAFSPDGKFLAAGGENKLVLWDLKERKEHARLESHRSPTQLVFAPDGKALVGLGYEPDHVAYLWDPVQAKKKGEINVEAGVVGEDAAFSPDGKTLAFVGMGDPGIFLWDFAAGRRLGVLSPDKNTIEFQICLEKVAFSRDGTHLATGAANGRVSLWSLPKKEVWAKKDRLERIEKLVLLLDDADYQRVWHVVCELLELGDEALPRVEKALGSEKLYQRRAAEFFFVRSAFKRNKHPPSKLFAQAAPQGMDYFVDEFRRKAKPKESDWQQVVELAQEAATRAKELGLPKWQPADYVTYPYLNGSDVKKSFIHKQRILAESMSTQHSAGESLIIASGPVTVKGQLYKSIVLANGDVKVEVAVESIVICNGKCEIGDVGKSLIICREKVKLDGFIGDSVIEQQEEFPLRLFRFFSPAQVGIEVSSVKGKLLVGKLETGKPFAKAGFQVGDEILAIDKAQVRSPEEFRNHLRRQLIQGRATVSIRRGEKALEIPVELSTTN